MRRAGRVAICGVAVVALSAVVAGTVVAKPSGPGPGNAPNAKACHKGGWQDLVRQDGTAFASEEECVSYAAQGGQLQAKPTAQQICEDAGGTFQAGGTDPITGNPLLWRCTGIPNPVWVDTVLSLQQQCETEGGRAGWRFPQGAGNPVDFYCFAE